MNKHIPSGNQTWQAGKSTTMLFSFNGNITELNSVLSIPICSMYNIFTFKTGSFIIYRGEGW